MFHIDILTAVVTTQTFTEIYGEMVQTEKYEISSALAQRTLISILHW